MSVLVLTGLFCQKKLCGFYARNGQPELAVHDAIARPAQSIELTMRPSELPGHSPSAVILMLINDDLAGILRKT